MFSREEFIKEKLFKKIYKIFHVALTLSFIIMLLDAVILNVFFVYLFYWFCIIVYTSSLVNYYLTFKKRIISLNYSVINFLIINTIPVLIITIYRYGFGFMTSIYFIIIIIAALILKQKEAVFISSLIIFLYLLLMILEIFGIIQPQIQIFTGYVSYITKIVVDIISLLLVTILITIISKNAGDSVKFYQLRSFRLSQIRKRLEFLVRKRTNQLEKSNKELKEAQAELNKNYKELKKLDVKKDEFISIAAHELKTPLTAIGGYAQLLEDEKIIKNPDKRKQFLDILKKESRRLSELVTEILNLSRIDLGVMKYNIESVDVYELMKTVENEFEPKISQSGLKHEFVLEKNLPKMDTDGYKLHEIVTNLISNAIKYTPRGKITAGVKRIGNFIQFSIEDTGIGIEKKNYNKIFKRFSQIDSSITREYKGSGLGLSICKEYVDKLGGKIWFRSKFGKGTTFYFKLPLKSKVSEKYTLGK